MIIQYKIEKLYCIITLGFNQITLQMSDDMRLFLIVETSIKLVIDVSFLVLYILRVHKLDRMASNNFYAKPKAVKVQMVLLLILQILFILHILLAYFYSGYWIHPYENFSLINLMEMFLCLAQIYIIRKQYKKKAAKALSIPVLWFTWLIFDLLVIIFVQIIIPSTTIMVLVLKAMCLVSLLVIAIFLEQKDVDNSEILDASNVTSLIPETRRTTERNTLSQLGSDNAQSSKLYIEFNKEFNITMKQNLVICQFKFAVFLNQQSHVVVKKEEDFLNLIAQMSITFPQCDDLKLKENRTVSFSNLTKYGQEKQKLYETYLVQVTSNERYYTNYLFDFLEINQANRIGLAKRREQTMFTRKQSVHSQDSEKSKKPFFKVELVNGKIHVSNPEILEIIINKSRVQIQKFHNRLIAQKRLKMELLIDQPDMNQILHFIFRVVNSKNLWRSFSQWLRLGKKLESKIYNMFDFWNFGFKNTSVNIIGHQIAFDNQGSIHTLYLLSITPKNKFVSLRVIDKQSSTRQGITLKKRFNDFVRLDKSIKKFINANNLKNVSIISLPPKFSPFGTKTSPKSRQIYLDMYINEVLKIQEINHCIQFLQFLEIDLGNLKDQFHTVDQQGLEVQQKISSIVIDDITMMEKSQQKQIQI